MHPTVATVRKEIIVHCKQMCTCVLQRSGSVTSSRKRCVGLVAALPTEAAFTALPAEAAAAVVVALPGRGRLV